MQTQFFTMQLKVVLQYLVYVTMAYVPPHRSNVYIHVPSILIYHRTLPAISLPPSPSVQELFCIGADLSQRKLEQLLPPEVADRRADSSTGDSLMSAASRGTETSLEERKTN